MKRTQQLLFLLAMAAGMKPGNAQNMQWARGLGGANGDQGICITHDTAGNVYTTGLFFGTADFDPGAGSANLTSAGNADIFVSKLDASGNFVWAKQLGGTSGDYGYGISTDKPGNVYTIGYFSSTGDFDPGPGTHNLTSAGGSDVVISKLDASGNFVWAKQFGGTGFEEGKSVCTDDSGNVYATGIFFGTVDFDPGAAVYNLAAAGGYDVFVVKLDSSGDLVWARQLGGATNDFGTSVAVDASGNVYSTGYFVGTADFDPGAGVYNLTSAGNLDVFISKLDGSGNFVWAKNLGGTLDDYGTSISVDAAGNVFSVGRFLVTADFDPGPGTYNLVSAGGSDIFVCRLDGSGNFVWVKQMGGANNDYANSVKVDLSGNVYLTGNFNGTADFDPGPGNYSFASAGNADIFICKLDGSGNFAWAGQLGGALNDIGYSVAVDPSGQVYSTGYFADTADFDPGAGTYALVAAGNTDIFVHKMSQGIVGIAEHGQENGVLVFPNPATTELIIRSGGSRPQKIEIFGAHGNLMARDSGNPEPETHIDVSRLAPGMYFVRITTARDAVTQKIVIQ